MMNHHSLADINKPTPQTHAVLGYTVFWRLGGVCVPQSELAQMLTRHAFGTYLPDPPTPVVALRRALLEWSRRLSREPLRVCLITKQPLVCALVRDVANPGSLSLSHAIHLRVLYGETTGDLICTTQASGPITKSWLLAHVRHVPPRKAWQEAYWTLPRAVTGQMDSMNPSR
jgi:hypothetical protein